MEDLCLIIFDRIFDLDENPSINYSISYLTL